MQHINELREGLNDRSICHELAETLLSTEAPRRPLLERDALAVVTDGLLQLLDLNDLPDYEEHEELSASQAEKFSLLREYLGRLSATADKKLVVSIAIETDITVDFADAENK